MNESPQDASHSSARHADLAPYLARVIGALSLPEEGYHLDIGCGDGASALAIARERPEMVIVAIDTDKEALARAKALAQREGLGNVNFVEAPAAAPPDAMFERVSALGVFNTLEDKRAALAAWRKITLPRGRLVLTDAFDTQSGTHAGAGATSHDDLAQLARQTGWRIIHRDDLTPLVTKLGAKRAGGWLGSMPEGARYSLVVLV